MGNGRWTIPIIQGGMGVGISLGGLAGAVAKEGGLGLISAAQIGFKEKDFKENTVKANKRAIHRELKKAREIAPQGMIGFNIMVALKNYEDYVKEAVKAGADIIVSGAGIPTELPSYVEGSDTKIAPIVSTDKSAKVILKYWEKKYKRLPDLMIIEGPKAGGHLGFKKEQLSFYDDKEYEKEILAILKTVKEFGDRKEEHIPVAVAGGVDTRQGVAHMLKLGADAVQIGTRFVTTKECDANIRFKEAYIQAEKEDIILVKSPVGMPGRAIRNPFMEKVIAGEKIPHGCHQCIKQCNVIDIPYCITEALIHGALGDVDNGLLFCGANAYKAHRIETVKEVMDSLLPDRT